ncbi:MAG: hypothetical protein M1546_14835 [Chloroflexi bacterium]|nr:hypothetical protein [Chloroflexota bacterium]
MCVQAKKHVSRRQILKFTASLAIGTGLTACMPAQVTQPTVASNATEVPVAPTEAGAAATAAVMPAATVEERLKKIGWLPGSPDHAKGWKTILPEVTSAPATEPMVVWANKRVELGDKISDDPKDSPMVQISKELFGLDFQTKFSGGGDDWTTKWTLAIASGDLPDFMEDFPTPVIFKQCLDGNLLEDITDVWEASADPTWMKKPLDTYLDGKAAYVYARQNGRLYGMPCGNRAANNGKLLWARQDWLDKLNLKMPTTLDEVKSVALAFQEAGLGQGAAGTTLGLNLCSSFRGWFASMDGITAQFGVISGFWLAQDDGTLAFADIMLGMKDALTLLRDWYAAGVIPKDYYTVPDADAMNKRAAGNLAGLHYAPAWGARWPVEDSMTNDPNAKWTWAQVPVGPSGKRGNLGEFTYGPGYAFKKGFKYVKQVMESMNWWVSLKEDPTKRYYGFENYDYIWDGDKVSLDSTKLKNKALGYGLAFSRGGAYVDIYADAKSYDYIESWKSIPEDQRDAWQVLQLDDPLGTQTNMRKSYSNIIQNDKNDGIFNKFLSAPTTSMVSFQTTLDKMRDETFHAIITGQKELDAFDQFVTDWKKTGGDQITTEVNEWYKSINA